ncbi:hypothetical protein DC090_02660 [Trueperella pyogenes]|nr:hypothetical protein DC090_02660 [Trueperella pyogenes]AWG16161.1 hypothetical protein DDE06_04585 [Trueperella pyogenes]AZR05044.1 hypothetical protein EBQ11_07190 [Trueperella pyogenes]
MLSYSELCQAAADHLQLSDIAHEEILPSGKPRYRNRINWACLALVKAGLVTRPERGMYQIAEGERTVDARNLTSYSEKDLLEWPTCQEYQQEIAERKANENSTPASVSLGVDTEGDPIEQAIDLTRIHNAAVETELRSKLQ